MSYRGREVESKWLIWDMPLTTLESILDRILPHEKKVSGRSGDTYWALQNQEVRGDFLRLRRLEDKVEITVKGNDRKDQTNRMELEINTDASINQATKLFRAVLGKPAGSITKDYHVFWPEEKDTHSNVSIYSVEHEDGKAWRYTVLEVETTDQEKLAKMEEDLFKLLDPFKLDLVRAWGSLFDMLIMPGENK